MALKTSKSPAAQSVWSSKLESGHSFCQLMNNAGPKHNVLFVRSEYTQRQATSYQHSYRNLYSYTPTASKRGPDSSAGIATELRAGRSGDRILVGRDFPPVQTGLGAHPASCTMGTESFPGVKYGRDVLLTTHHLLVPRSWKSRPTPLPTLWASTMPVKADSHIACRSHVVPLPCPAAKGLECVFPI